MTLSRSTAATALLALVLTVLLSAPVLPAPADQTAAPLTADDLADAEPNADQDE
jgi:hypothetical protein